MSDDSDEKEMRLRDQYAMSVFQAMLSSKCISIPYADYIQGGLHGEYDYKNGVEDVKIVRAIEVSYRIADIMRKVRLKVFE